jgi:anthraniloyl-CoA monooxygenase
VTRRIACLGGGPAGAFAAILAKKADRARHVEVWERNPPGASYGFGIVFSEEAMSAIARADADIHRAVEDAAASWSDIDITARRRTLTSGGHHFLALPRVEMATILQRRLEELGVVLHFESEAPRPDELGDFDLLIASDGANSTTRALQSDWFKPAIELGACKYIWLAVDRAYDAFKFFILETDFGVVQVHAYPYSAHESTFIVEMHENVWKRAGFEQIAPAVLAPGESDLASIARLQDWLADLLGDRRLIGNNSRWQNFPTIRVERWQRNNIVLVGDAAHTAHFSIGSATKLAVEDAAALTAALASGEDLQQCLVAYQAERQPLVESTQRAAAASRDWFENLDQYLNQSDLQLAFNLLTRSRRITYENLRLRDADFVGAVDSWFASEVSRSVGGRRHPRVRPPMFMPFELRDLRLSNRVVVSPMDMYSARDGIVGDFHLVHLAGRALGGAGLVMSEMLCVSAEGRITPGCAGLWREEQLPAWQRIVEFVHQNSEARVGVQLGHSGRKGSTRLLWEGVDEPLPDGNWPLIAPSGVPYSPISQRPREMTRADMDEIQAQFVRATELAVSAGFDLLELHMAHGYLLSSFLSPLSNRRADAYGGDLANRARYPLEVFDAVRAVWPAGKPISVRISATDWVPGAFDREDSIAFAEMLKVRGCDIIDVSTGQTSVEAKPAYGRSYQTPFSDAVRNLVGIPTIAVGAISSYDDVNSILLAGRADLCALARPHLYDPSWTLHAAADQGYAGEGARWPDQYLSGSRAPQVGRKDFGAEPSPFEEPVTAFSVQRRWRPEGPVKVGVASS